jgi:uncharacterized protein
MINLGFDNALARAMAATRPTRTVRTMYHGTSAVLAADIEIEGLRSHALGSVYVTDSHEIAVRYAIWESARQAATRARPAPRGEVGRAALALGGHVGAVITVRAPDVPWTISDADTPPPLPWETTMLVDGLSYFTDQAVTPDALGPFELWSIPELDDPAQVKAVCLVSERICGGWPAERRGTRIHRSIPNVWDLLGEAVAASGGGRSRLHGETHWLGVMAAAVRLVERGSRADAAVLLTFCLLHDCQRRSEGLDPEHGKRAADLADELHTGNPVILRLDSGQRAALRRALIDHDRGMISDDPTIGACWDADRLTLTRLGVTVNPRLLSTPQGRALAATPGAVPDPAECDWNWALSQMYVLAATRGAPRRPPPALPWGGRPAPDDDGPVAA